MYFTQNTKTKGIKIGYSKNPKQRRSGLQTASEDDLVILGYIHGELEDERAYHQKFAEYRIKGEWFKPDILPAVLEIIAKNPLDRPPPSNVMVVGDGNFFDQGLVWRALDELYAKNRIAWVVTAGERALEHWAWAWASRNKVDVYRYYPKWRTRGRFAGFEASRRLLRAMFDHKTFLAFLGERPGPSILRLIARAQKMGYEVVVKGQQPVVQA
jgi:hypothetical protein